MRRCTGKGVYRHRQLTALLAALQDALFDAAFNEELQHLDSVGLADAMDSTDRLNLIVGIQARFHDYGVVRIGQIKTNSGRSFRQQCNRCHWIMTEYLFGSGLEYESVDTL